MADSVEIVVTATNLVEVVSPSGSSVEALAASTSLVEVVTQGPQGTPGIATANFIIDSGGAAILTGVKGSLVVPFNCVISGWTLTADVSGSIQIDIWKATYAAYPPTVANTISPSNKALISASNKATSSTLTGWSPTINAGDILVFNVDRAPTISRVTLGLNLTRT